MAADILVVDDDATIRQLLRHRFEAAGFAVRTCEDGKEAADLLSAEYDPDALVVDVMMPRLNGTRLVRMLRNGELNVGSDLPVIMLTSRGREEHVLEGFDAGVDDYISKPFRSAELLARVRRQLP
jgi:two-component system response regulator MprA